VLARDEQRVLADHEMPTDGGVAEWPAPKPTVDPEGDR
jgi:hypothetical protein